jgi:hypothetical protein
MPNPQTFTLSPRVAARPCCPKCQSRMEVQHIASARSGFEHWTLRCTQCRLIHEAQVNADPMKSDAIGVMPPLDARTAEPRSKAFDRMLSLIATFIVVAIIVVARY